MVECHHHHCFAGEHHEHNLRKHKHEGYLFGTVDAGTVLPNGKAVPPEPMAFHGTTSKKDKQTSPINCRSVSPAGDSTPCRASASAARVIRCSM
jgi:hypothetical protein